MFGYGVYQVVSASFEFIGRIGEMPTEQCAKIAHLVGPGITINQGEGILISCSGIEQAAGYVTFIGIAGKVEGA